MTITRLEPSDWILAAIEFWAPWPIATMAMTEAMPITMPKIVKDERTLLPVRDQRVSFKRSIIID
jgi:hypothetical protein